MKPLISIIVPVYNAEKYLERCIKSIVGQTYENIEIILVDDGSPDNCPAICDEWAEKDSRIKVIHKQNGGAASSRNAGMKIMHGEYVCFVDSDDYIELKFVEVMYSIITNTKSAVCVCNVNHIDVKGKILDTTEFKEYIIENEEIMQAFLKTDVFDSSSVCTKLYSVSIIKENDLSFNESNVWGEDYSFNYWYFKCIKKMISIEDCLYNYQQGHEGSVTDGMTYGRVCRWMILKNLLPNEQNNLTNYSIALKKYVSELLCCCRELLRSGNKDLIKQCYPLIVDEIKSYKKEFIKLSDLNRVIKLSVILISLSPVLFKLLYKIMLKVKK